MNSYSWLVSIIQQSFLMFADLGRHPILYLSSLSTCTCICAHERKIMYIQVNGSSHLKLLNGRFFSTPCSVSQYMCLFVCSCSKSHWSWRWPVVWFCSVWTVWGMCRYFNLCIAVCFSAQFMPFWLYDLVYCPRDYSQKIRVGWGFPKPLPYFCMTKICDFPFPVYDLTKHLIPYLWPLQMAQLPKTSYYLWRAFVDSLINTGDDEKALSSFF